MSDVNPNCDGAHCVNPDGQVRLYALGGGGNLYLCRVCWAHENFYRRMCAKDYMAKAKREHDANQFYKAVKDEADRQWPQLDWHAAKTKEEQYE